MRNHTQPADSCYCHASSIQTLPVSHFPSSLEWSNDGQAFAITRANIHLWTPCLGYSVPPEDLHQQSYQQNPPTSAENAPQDPPATSSSASVNPTQPQPSSSVMTSAQPHQTPMLTTSIEVDKQFGCNWVAHSNEVHIITPPNDDRFWRMANWSPSGLSSLGSCLIAGLTTTCDVFVFSPSHNFQSGLWEMGQPKKNLSEELLRFLFECYPTILRATPDLQDRKGKIKRDKNDMDIDRPGNGSENGNDVRSEKVIEEEEVDITPETEWSESKEARSRRSRLTSCVLRAQTTALAWSPGYCHPSINDKVNQILDQSTSSNSRRPAFDLGCYDVDFSLLALGHRRGDISLWRHTSNGHMELVCFKPICPDGLTLSLLSWSDWSLCQKKIHVETTDETIEGTTKNTDENQYQLTAYLAIGNSKGVVFILQVSQPFERRGSSSSSIGENTSSTSFQMKNSDMDIQISLIYQDQLNLSSITCMKWIPALKENHPSTLVLSRLGEIVFIQVPPRSEEPHGPVYSSTPTNHQIIQLPALHHCDDRLCWPDSHSWASCSGISIIPIKKRNKTEEIHNRIIVMLSNGLIYVIDQTSSSSNNKQLKQSVNLIRLDLQHSIQLSLDFRSKFRNITLHQSFQPQNNNNLGPISKQNLMNVYGSSVLSTVLHVNDQLEHQHYLGSTGSIMSWLYEIDSPNKFCYKPENRQILHFCMADFDPVEISFGVQDHQHNLSSTVGRRRSKLIGMLQSQVTILPALFENPTSCIQVSPNLKLMNILNVIHLIFADSGLTRLPSFLESLTSSLSEIFDLLDNHNDYEDGSSREGMDCDQQQTDWLDDNNPSIDSFILVKAYLVQRIFYNHHLDKLRLKFNLTSFLLSRIDKNQPKNLRTRLVDIKVKISRTIHKGLLNILARCFQKYQARLKRDDEKTIMSKYNFASKVIGIMPEPTLEQLLEPEEIDHKLLDQDRLLSSSSFLSPAPSPPPSELGHAIDNKHSSIFFKQEYCPACLETVHFDSLRFAICKTGHIWDRCSVTFEILSMMELKICTNCGRKSKKNSRLMMHKVELEEGRGTRSNQDKMQETNDVNDNHNNNQVDDHSSFLDFFLDSFICCPHCGGRWKISA